MSNDVMTGISGGLVGNTYGLPSQELQDLSKALGTGQLVGNNLGDAYVDGGAPFRVQSLEGILKVVTFQDRNIIFWRDIPKLQAYNTVEEYNRLVSYGGAGSGFFKEGGLPKEDDSQYERKAALVKFMGTTGIVTHALSLVRSAHGDVIGREAKNRTLALLKQVELALFFGNSEHDSLAFDGIEKVISDEVIAQGKQNIVDMRGSALDEETLEDVSQIISDEFGVLTTMYLGNKALTDLAKQILPNGRFSLPFGDQAGRLGYRIRHFDSQTGSFELKPNVFLKPGAAPKAVADSGAPASPTVTSLVAGANAASKFTAQATHYYAVAALNSDGESLPSAVSNVSVSVGEAVTITIASVPAGAKYYKIYRGTSAANIKEMITVKATGGVIHIDKNDDLPGTAKAFGIMLDAEQGLSFKQLAPLMKMDLATIAASYRFMILLYGVPVVYAPSKMVIIKNIGSL
jgi:hypothetical protein